MSITTHNRNDKHQPVLSSSLLAAYIAIALTPSVCLADGNGNSPPIELTTMGTKIRAMQEDIPQSISVVSKQNIGDHNLQTIGAALDSSTTGINNNQIDSDREVHYSRGFQIDDYMVDGSPTYFQSRWNLGDNLNDTALYESIELLRGAKGLTTGIGNPSLSVNLISKHASSHKFKGSISAEYGSWGKQRYVTDLQTPLTKNGNIRTRAIIGYQKNKSWLSRYGNEKMLLASTLDADLSRKTGFSTGYEYQHISSDSPTWGGLPRWNDSGRENIYNRSLSTAPKWAYNNKEMHKAFLGVKKSFFNSWQTTFNLVHSQVSFDSKGMYLDAYVDKKTGRLVSPYSGYGKKYEYVGGTSSKRGKREFDTVSLFSDGSYSLFNRRHKIIIGGSYIRQHDQYLKAWSNIFSEELGNSYYKGDFPETDWGPSRLAQDDTTQVSSLYAATNISLSNPLHITVGARYTNWCAETLDGLKEKDYVTPYASLMYDNSKKNWSTYISYSSFFQPQSYGDKPNMTANGMTSKNYEFGLKSDWIDGLLETNLSIFQVNQDRDDSRLENVSKSEHKYTRTGTVRRGVELEVNGAVSNEWHVNFGTTYFMTNNKNDAVKTELPRANVRLLTDYRLPFIPEVTIGGRINWQSGTYADTTTPQQNRWQSAQNSYSLVGLFTHYQLSKNISLQGNINNLFDKKYDANIDGPIVYGEPRNISITANYQF